MIDAMIKYGWSSVEGEKGVMSKTKVLVFATSTAEEEAGI